MAISEELLSFVKDALAQGRSRQQVEEVLLQAGWSAEQVRGALAGFAEVEFPIPVPRPKQYVSAREAFMYLVLFGTLYLSACHLGNLLVLFINQAFPDPAASAEAVQYAREAMRWSVSYLIIAFPVFLYVSRLVGRAIRLAPTKRASKVRRWLTYLTLFIAAAVLTGDGVTMIYNVLSGELSVRFVLKVLSVGMIAGSIFGYYLSDLRQEEKEIRI
jgi:hypothetical protein